MLFSATGELAACNAQLVSWPSMSPIADLKGIALGWGTLDGTDTLLVQGSGDGFTTLSGSGDREVVNTSELVGRITPSWSPSREAIWLESGVQTEQLRLDAWTPEGRRPLAAVANVIGATNITASPNERWVAIWGGGCAVSQQGADCTLTIGAGEAASGNIVPVAGGLDGTLASAWVANDGTLLFTVAGQNGRVALWRSDPGSGAEIWYENATISTLNRARLAVTSSEGAVVVDLATATDTPLILPEGVAPASVISVAPDGEWLAYSSQATIAFSRREAPTPAAEVSFPSLAGASILWPSDQRFACVFFGPPPTNLVVRLSD
jgi:hypothetical protein